MAVWAGMRRTTRHRSARRSAPRVARTMALWSAAWTTAWAIRRGTGPRWRHSSRWRRICRQQLTGKGVNLHDRKTGDNLSANINGN